MKLPFPDDFSEVFMVQVFLFVVLLVVPGIFLLGLARLFIYLEKRGVKTYVLGLSKMNGWERRLRKKLDRAKRKRGHYQTIIRMKYK
jgi:putative ribosome biogenesis GTPase RsgA